MKNIRFGIVGRGRRGMRRIKRIAEHTNSELICVADAQEDNVTNKKEEDIAIRALNILIGGEL
ncbi:MAG: hypothetical protein KAW47_11005 [Thermoplasmatales archaeon]|nr:hypothetical protein [Thermoplasmatales archaeon]